jgi:hypothetical protein
MDHFVSCHDMNTECDRLFPPIDGDQYNETAVRGDISTGILGVTFASAWVSKFDEYVHACN